ncbi:hypothetical protein ET445_01650 [Agromyces protaetiae]|uniref:BP74 N-terminal domain-containing protein n=1 Tax=Agromyces protaetiae TaxID=2509455 RepID=A0A4P6FF85_9MICO|nr:hypothetical protein ET445_01650 [Agromyces protaetiae]
MTGSRLHRPLAATASAVGLALTLTLTACASTDAGPSPTDSAGVPAGLAGVATFQVEGGDGPETFRIGLASTELVDHAQQLLAGEEVAAIPVGKISYDGDGGVNAPWSWHIDPKTLEFADMTTEVCDGLPSFVERHEVTSDTYCPWSSTVVAVEVAK